jgi:hypothetical protein
MTQFPYAVTAFNSSAESDNRIHADEVASKFGFTGGLVAGVDVFAYMTRPAVDKWGALFLDSGAMRARFRNPVYDGDAVTVAGSLDTREHMTLSLSAKGAPCAEGVAFIDAHSPEILCRAAPPPWFPGAPKASPESLPKGHVLGTLHEFYMAEAGRHHLDDIRETHPIYQRGRIAHPGFLLRRANFVLAYNVKLGPWIHGESDVRLHDMLEDGEPFETRAQVLDNFERGGHRIVVLEFSISSQGRAIMTGRHTAIYEPRQVRDGR